LKPENILLDQKVKRFILYLCKVDTIPLRDEPLDILFGMGGGGGGGEILMEFIQAFEEWKQILQLNRKTERKIPAQLLHCENKFDKASNLKKFLQRKFSLSLI
jgi:hypothetical protein